MLKKISYTLILLTIMTGCSGGSKAKTKDSTELTKQTTSEKIVKKSTEQTTTEQSTAKKEEKAVEEKQQLNEPLVIDGLEITVSQLETSNIIVDGQNKKLYGFDVHGKNISSVAKGLGAIDFVLTTEDGKEYELDDSISAFGNELKQEEEIEGKIYFSIESGKKVKTVGYKPSNEVLISWEIN